MQPGWTPTKAAYRAETGASDDAPEVRRARGLQQPLQQAPSVLVARHLTRMVARDWGQVVCAVLYPKAARMRNADQQHRRHDKHLQKGNDWS